MTQNEENIDPSLFRRAAEQTLDYAVFLLDPGGHILSWSAGAERLKGYAREEILGKHFSVFYPPEAVQSGWPAYELEMAGREGRFEDEGWRLRRDGSRFWASVVITALRDEAGKLLAFSKITRDVTDRMLQQEALRQSEERFRLLIEGISDYAIYMLDPNGVVTSWNAGAERITGYSRDQIIGRHFSTFFTEDAIKQGRPWAELATARTTGRAEDEDWRVRRNGEPFWARVVVTAVHDTQGQLRGYAKVTQDLTQRRHLEDLQKVAGDVNEFIATLAHELRNPLAPVRNAVQAMAHLPPNDPMREILRETIDRQSASLARIVDDLIDISRITRGGLVMSRTIIDVGEAIREAIEAAAPLIEAGAHSLEVNLPQGTLHVLGDVHRLAQVFVNLLNNAARYSGPGGRITIEGVLEGRSAIVRVRDTGNGIAPELIPRIFDMFVQGRSALQRVGGGLGIGLAVARKIAELHGGTIEAASAGINQGSTFTVRLPLAEEAAVRARTAAARPEKQPTIAKRVLVVDDNVDAALTLESLLRALGHETRVAHDGVRAIELAADFSPQVVLLDIGMPGLSGYDVARQLRATGSKMRIVAVTGWSQEADRRRSAEAGFDLHLVKPVNPDQLTSVLAQANGNGTTLH